MSSVSVDTAPVAPETGGSPRRRSRSKGGESGRAGWLVKMVVAVLCLLWLIPTIGLLVTSFRPGEAANNSGQALFTRTVLNESVSLRFSIGARLTTERHVLAGWHLLQSLL